MILKLVMQHQGLKLYKVYMNDDPGLTLTYFKVRSSWVAYMFEWGKTVTKSLAAKDSIIVFMKKMFLRGLSATALGLNTCI